MKLAYMMTTPEADPMPLCWHGEPAHIIRRVAEIGYEGIELQVRDPSAFDTKAIGKLAAGAGLKIAAISTGSIGPSDNLYLTSADPEVRRRAIDRYKLVLQLAHEYGVDSSIGRFRGTTKWAPSREVGLGWFRSAMEELVPLAESLGVRIVLEPQTRYNCDMLNSIAETVAFIESFASTALAFEADLHHQALEEKSLVVSLIEGFKSGHMTYVQLGDSNRLAPGWGNFNWVDILGTLKAIGYDGWLAMEFLQRPDSDRCAQQAYAFVKRVLADERP
ncbi:MAG: sugar phosphate isomerase/epimerase [Candidatus Elarobacter sp.]